MITPVNKKDIHKLYNQLKQSAAKRGHAFDLSLTDLNDLTFPITCPILGIPLFFNRGKQQDDSYSIDRIDSSKGYTADNIVVISTRANKIKTNATLDELESIVIFFKGM